MSAFQMKGHISLRAWFFTFNKELRPGSIEDRALVYLKPPAQSYRLPSHKGFLPQVTWNWKFFLSRLRVSSLPKTFQCHLGSAVIERNLIISPACSFDSSLPYGFCWGNDWDRPLVRGCCYAALLEILLLKGKLQNKQLMSPKAHFELRHGNVAARRKSHQAITRSYLVVNDTLMWICY